MSWLGTKHVMKQWRRKKIMEGLKELVPDIECLKSENFLDKTGGIMASGRIDNWFYKGLIAFEYEIEHYGEFPLSEAGEKDSMMKEMKIKLMYVDKIHKEIHHWLTERGWYLQWFGGSTLFFWPFNIKGYGK